MQIPTNKRLIMIYRDMPKPLLLLLLSILSVTFASCAVKWEARTWLLQNPELKVPTETFKYTFQFGNVSLEVDSEMLTSRTLAYGPPFMPFIRVATPETPLQFDFQITIDSPLDTTEMDFSKGRIEIPGKEILRVQTINLFRFTSKRDKYGLPKWERTYSRIVVRKKEGV